MLVELIRYKSKLPYDYYKEIVLNYQSESYIEAPRKDERSLHFMRSYRMQQGHRSCIRI